MKPTFREEFEAPVDLRHTIVLNPFLEKDHYLPIYNLYYSWVVLRLQTEGPCCDR